MRNASISPAELSYQLGDLPDRGAYLAAACSCLGAAVGGDVVGWTDIDLAARAVEIWSDPPPVAQESGLIHPVLTELPTIHHYKAHPGTFDPLRLSDIVPARKWRSHRAYHEFFRPLGLRHQLAIAVPPRTPERGSGWYINRAAGDFTGENMAVARALQPMLSLLNVIYPPDGRPAGAGRLREEARERAGLTPREVDILALVAEGLTARQIATLRRISVRTVGKHLEHVYEKLGCHDRLQAANKARALGLI